MSGLGVERAPTAPRYLVPLLASLTALVVLTTDVYIPVLPRLVDDFGTTAEAGAATLSGVLVGVAGGQVVLGPLSDALGRRLPLLFGTAAYALLHLLAALSPTIEALLMLRFATGIATAGCLVVGRAIVTDVYPGDSAARAYATLGAVTAIAPVLAPLLGGVLSRFMDWRGMFVVLAGTAVVVAVVAARVLPETLPPSGRIAPRPREIVRELGSVLALRPFLGFLGSIAAIGGLLFGYIGASSFVLQDGYGLTPQEYSYAFAANAVGIVGASMATRHLVTRLGSRRILALGHAVAVAGTVVLAVGVGVGALPVVLAGLFVAVSSVGFVVASTTALGMAAAPGRAGAASGLLGIAQFAAGAVASPLAGIGGSPWSLVIVIGAAAAIGPLAVALLSGKRAVAA